MYKQRSHARIFALLLGVATLLLAGWVSADPPNRVARLGYTSGAVSFSPGGENDWVLATVNRPLINGDRLWVDAGARAELQVGSAVIRMSGSTSVTLLNLNDRVAQVQLAQGTLNIRVRRFGPKEVFEIATPNLAYSIRQPGEYRIDVDPAGNTTAVVVRSGRAEVYGDGAAYVVNAKQAYRFAGTDLRDYEYIDVPRADEFDGWSSERDRRGAVAARYVSRDVIGYEDLDEHGSWRAAEGYGNVWVPNRVATDWVPYRDGHWTWVDPWGWTWVDDAPWGFAVSHYGRWANMRGTWVWVPGPVRSQAVYAPALVAFVGGSNFQISVTAGNVAGVAWFPLGPRDVYRPSYPASRGYFNNINTSNTTINTTNITNVYNTTNVRNVTYVNQQVPGAVVGVPSTAFVQSQPVGRAGVRLSKEQIAKAPVTAVATVVPVQASVRGVGSPGRQPPAEAQKRRIVAKASPPPAPIPFAAKQPALAANSGKPLDAAALAKIKPSEPALIAPVKVISSTPPVVVPPKRKPVSPGLSQPSEDKKGPRAREAEKAAQSPVIVPRPPEAQKPSPQTETQKGPQPSEDKKGPRARDAEKAVQPPVIVPRPPEVQKPSPQPEIQKAPQSSDDKKGSRAREAEKAAQPPVIVPRPPEVQKPSPQPEFQKAPPQSDEKKGPRARDAEKTTPPAVIVPRPPEVQKPLPPPPEAKSRPQQPEAQVVPQAPPEARKPPANVSKPPEVPPVQLPAPYAANALERRGAKKDDERLKREEEDKNRRP